MHDGIPTYVLKITSDSFEIMSIAIHENDTFGLNPVKFSHQGISADGKTLNCIIKGPYGPVKTAFFKTDDFLTLNTTVWDDSGATVTHYYRSNLPSTEELKSNYRFIEFVEDSTSYSNVEVLPDSLIEALLLNE